MSATDIKIGKRFSIVIPKEIRTTVPLKEGQRVRVKAEGQRIIIEPYPADPFKVLESVLGDLVYDKSTRREAAKWLLQKATQRSKSS